MTPDDFPKNAKDFFAYAKKNQAEMVDLKFVDMLGSWQHCSFPDRHARRRHLRGGPGVRRLVDSRLDGHPRVRHDGGPRPRHGPPRSVLREADDQRNRQHRRSRSAGRSSRAIPRHIARKAEAYLKKSGDRRHLLHRARAGVLHLRRGPVRTESASRLLPDRFSGRRLEHGADRGAESRIQAELQGRLFPGEPDRYLPRSARRDGLRDAQDRDRRRSAPSRGRHGRPERNRHEVPAAAQDGRSVHVVQVHLQERREATWQDRHVHAEADLRRQRQRHAHAYLAVEEAASRCLPATATRG